MKSKKSIKGIVIFTVLGFVALFFMNTSFAANTAKIKVETANLRETADAEGKIIKQLSIDEEVEIVEKSGDWYKVKSKDITGYIRQDLLSVKEENTDNNTTNNIVVDTVVDNTTTTNETTVENTGATTDANNSETVQEEKTKLVSGDTKLKIVPAINATDIIEVKANQEVTIIETINNWVCIQAGNTKGWIRSEKLKGKEEQKAEDKQEEQEEKNETEATAEETKIKTQFIISETVNLRKEPNTNSEIVSKLSLNMAVDVYSENGGWSKVKVSGKEGYVSSSLLSDKKKETSRASETPRTNDNTNTQTNTSSAPVSKNGGSVVETAKSYIGSSYVYGGSGPSSFDCSGFTSYIYKQYGVSLNRTAAGQYSNGTAVSKDELQPGDLVMFGKSGINHVGIYIGGGQMVHAANPSRGVTTDTINSGYYYNNYVGARRVN